MAALRSLKVLHLQRQFQLLTAGGSMCYWNEIFASKKDCCLVNKNMSRMGKKITAVNVFKPHRLENCVFSTSLFLKLLVSLPYDYSTKILGDNYGQATDMLPKIIQTSYRVFFTHKCQSLLIWQPFIKDRAWSTLEQEVNGI